MSNNDFEFKYSAPTSEERKHIESIRNKYLPKEEGTSKLDRLIKLDKIVKNMPTTVAIIVGIVGILIFGLGFAMVLEWKVVDWGVVIAVVGLVVVLIAYPIYLKIGKYLSDKHSKEILQISDELLKDKNEGL